jgi:hypothetical protein
MSKVIAGAARENTRAARYRLLEIREKMRKKNQKYVSDE